MFLYVYSQLEALICPKLKNLNDTFLFQCNDFQRYVISITESIDGISAE